jgi:hypothetical protein
MSGPSKPTRGPGAKAVEQAPPTEFAVADAAPQRGQKVVIYGPGGIGKSTLASLVREVGRKPIFVDAEDGALFVQAQRVSPNPETFQQVLEAIPVAASLGDVVVLDSLTRCEELAVEHVLSTIAPADGGGKATGIEAYGYGKGYMYVYEAFLKLLSALDGVARQGKGVVAIAHDCVTLVRNPDGSDYPSFEPRLQSPPMGKASIRNRVREWCDHLLFLGWDVFVTKEGKAQGGGSRTIYPQQKPAWWAKSRFLSEPVPFTEGDATLWQQVFSR